MTRPVLIFMMCLALACSDKKETKQDELNSEANLQTKPDVKATEASYNLGSITVILRQVRSEGPDFYCKSKLISKKNNKVVDSIDFDIEPVGGVYGVSKGLTVNNHLVFSKQGDYDGRTIIVSPQGKISDVMGGTVYYDPTKDILLSIYDSDLSGFSMYDLKNDKLVLDISDFDYYPVSFFKIENDRYLMICYNIETNEKSVWEIESDLERVMQVDININTLNETNQLKKLELNANDCVCK